MFGKPLRHLGETASTNDDAMKWAREDAPHGSVVRADAQTRGRGRLGRSWVSPANLGLYFSVVLRPENLRLENVSQLTMLAALSCVHAIEEISGLRANVKWPNDVVLHGRKIGGILSEASIREASIREASINEASIYGTAAIETSSTRSSHFVDFAVVGIGLNVDFQPDDLPRDAKIPATSLRMESGDIGASEALFAAVLNALQNNYTRWSDGAWPQMRAEFARRDILQNSNVRVEAPNETYRGVARGIADNGVLLVQTADGTREVVAGDVVLEP